jgi:molybdate transport system substrate-binding protein
MTRCIFLLLLALHGAKAQAADVFVHAAASLGSAFREIAPLFEAAHPGQRVRLNLGASGALVQQIAHGAPADVFASADVPTMDQAQARALIDATQRRDFARNTLVLVVPAKATAAPRALADLALPSVTRIALGVPDSVPAGRYAQDALEAAGLWPAVRPKTIGAHHVRQALDYVARGEVDAGFVYATDAALMPDKVRVAFTVRTAQPIVYPVAALAAAPNPAGARAFVAFLLTPAAGGVLARHGFDAP